MADTGFRMEDVEKIETSSLRRDIYDRIKGLILFNQLRPGQAIVITELASVLGVSHTPVREALAMLELDGLIVAQRYKNPRVSEIKTSDVREVYELRLVLESWAVGKAIVNLTEEELDATSEVLQRSRRAAQQSDYDTLVEADVAFHGVILKSTGNILFSRLAQWIADQSVRVRSLVEATGSGQYTQSSIEEHCAILEALRARDPELACKGMVLHLEAAMERTLSVLQDVRRWE